MTNIQQVIAEMIPSSLDDIVRLNRDQVQIGLATLDELTTLEGAIEPGPTQASPRGRTSYASALSCTNGGFGKTIGAPEFFY
jgi:hypothetical protein